MTHKSDFFEELKSTLHPNYLTDFRNNNSNELVIVFSPNARFSMFNIQFSADVLFIADRKLHYYIYNPGRQVSLINNFVTQCQYDKVTLIGSSKGGSGALLWSSLLSKSKNRQYSVKCFSFSPQVSLYPESKVIDYPSYKNMLKTASNNINLTKCLEVYGDISSYISNSLASTIVFYSGMYSIDRHEAQLLREMNVTLVQLPLTFHGSITPYLINKNIDKHLQSIVAKLFSNASKDPDLASTLPSSENELIRTLSQLDTPHITDLLKIF